MKGIIFNLLESYIIEEHHDQLSYDDIIESCNLKTTEPFVGPGTYPDEDLTEIIVRSANKLGTTPDDVLRSFGKFIFPRLVEMVPQFVEPYRHPKEFLKSVDNIIHVEIHKMYENSYTPSFTYSEQAPDQLTIRYYSKRKLYALMEGLIEGVSEYFDVEIKQSKKILQVNGKEVCDYDLRFNT